MRKKFELPESILSQMEEMSGGGFLLFILNEDNEIIIYESFDGHGQEAQVKNFAIDWLDSDRQARKEILKNEMMDGYYMDIDEKYEQDDDEEE